MRLMILLFALYSLAAVAEESLTDEQADSESVITEPVAVERPALRSRHQLELQRLQHAFPEQFRPLSSEHDVAGALYLPANRSTAKGWVILLPGSGQTADSARNIDAVRQILPDSGWHTLSLQMPTPPFAALHISPPPEPPPATTDEESATEPDEPDEPQDAATETLTATDDEPPETNEGVTGSSDDANTVTATTSDASEPPLPEYSERILALLDAAIDIARKEAPDKLVLLGQEEGAYWISLWLTVRNQQADALVLLHAQQPDTATLPLPELTGQLNLPFLDLFIPQNIGESQAARQRLNSSSRNADNQYRQTTLREPAHSLRQNELVRRVKGWLSRL